MLSRICSDWLFLASILAFFLKFFLTFFLACYPASILSFFLASICHLFNSDILSDMYASYRTYTWIEMGSKECRPSWSILTSTLIMLFWHSLSVIPSDILSGMCLGPDPDRVRKCRSGPGRYHNTLAIWGSGAGVAHRIRSWQTGRRRQKEWRKENLRRKEGRQVVRQVGNKNLSRRYETNKYWDWNCETNGK